MNSELPVRHPPVSEGTERFLQVVLPLLANEKVSPTELINFISESPWPASIKSMFADLYRRIRDAASQASDITDEELNSIDVEKEARKLFVRMTRHHSDFGEMDASERNQYFRVRTALLEKLQQIEEKAKDVKKRNEHDKLIFDIFSDILTVDQKELFLEKLKALVE